MSEPVRRIRSLLFMPGDKPALIAKIPRFRPDVAVVDLEDAVAPAAKTRARELALHAIDALPAGAATVLVRVNPIDTQWFTDDLVAAAACAATGIVVPKLDTVAQLAHLRDELARLSWTSAVIVAGIETVLGVADSREVLAAGIDAAYFGAEDFIADLGGRRTRAGTEVLYARSQVVLAARLAGIPAVDQAVVDFGDDEHFRADARGGMQLGYQGKICIHPRQVELSNEAFTPTADEIGHARRVVAASTDGEDGVVVIDGEMVDDVHVRMARAVLARANADTLDTLDTETVQGGSASSVEAASRP